MLMLDKGDVDCVVAGVNATYPDAVRDALQIIGTNDCKAAALHLIALKDRTVFVADTSINITPSAEELCDIAITAADMAQGLRRRARGSRCCRSAPSAA